MGTNATRRDMLIALARASVLAGGSAFLAGCAATSNGSLGVTSALPGSAPVADAAREAQPPAAKAAVKAALILPLSGGVQLALVGQSLKQAAELALMERNAPALELVIKDDLGTPDGARVAVTQALADGAEIILGPLLGTSVAAVAPIARQAGVPVIAFSNDPANGGNGVHLLSFFVKDEVRRVVRHALDEGRRQFAALVPEDVLGRDAEPAFRQAVEQGGGRLVAVERYPGDLSGIADPAQRIMELARGTREAGSGEAGSGVDALFLPSSGDNVPRLVAMVRHHQIEGSRTRLVLTGGWDTPATLREPRLAGALLAAPEPRGFAELSTRFGRAYNAAPSRLASLAYDAVTVAAAFASQPRGQRYTAPNLTREAGFAGIDGPFRLTSAGPVERSLAVLEVQPQGLVVVAQPSGFGASEAARPAVQLDTAQTNRG